MEGIVIKTLKRALVTGVCTASAVGSAFIGVGPALAAPATSPGTNPSNSATSTPDATPSGEIAPMDSRPCNNFWVLGEIEKVYYNWRGPNGVRLGCPKTNELTTPDGIGRFNFFEWPLFGEAAVYWTPGTGARPVFGAILWKWGNNGYERGRYGYPTGNPWTANGVWYQQFQGGIIDDS